MSEAKQATERVGNSVWLERLVRVGLVAYGVVHLLIAWLALQIAFGTSPQPASQQGAMHTLAKEPLGEPLLWGLTLGLAALVVWQLVEAAVGHSEEDGAKLIFGRVVSGVRAVVYAFLAYSALSTAVGSGSSQNKDRLTARLLDLPLGQLLVSVLGAVIIGVGVAVVYKGVTQSFVKELHFSATSGSSGTALVTLGRFGYAAKGLALSVVGGLFVWAAWTYDAQKAGGLDVALKTLTTHTLGPWLLAVVALGVGSFGLYCFGWARYANPAA